eukprot:4303900-Prymnesium_polylepis.1
MCAVAQNEVWPKVCLLPCKLAGILGPDAKPVSKGPRHRARLRIRISRAPLPTEMVFSDVSGSPARLPEHMAEGGQVWVKRFLVVNEIVAVHMATGQDRSAARCAHG